MQVARKESLLAFKKAIVVEPVSHLRQMTVGLLKNTSLEEIAMCNTPFEGVEMIGLHNSELLLCGSSHGTALALSLMLRHGVDSPNREITILMLASRADQESVVAARDSGVDSVLAVPFSANSLANRLISLSKTRPPFVETNTYVGPDRRRQVKGFNHEDRRSYDTPPSAVHKHNCSEILQRFIKTQTLLQEFGKNKQVPAGSPKQSRRPAGVDSKTLRCTARDLEPNMCLQRPCLSKSGLTIVSKGVPLTKRIIMRLIDMAQAGEVDDVFVVES